MKIRSFGQQWNLQQQFAKALEDPDKLLKREFIEKIKGMAELLAVTIETRGWKEIIQPFIESNLTPDRLLNATEDEKKELKAFNKLYKLVMNITKMSDKALEMEERNDSPDEV